LAEEQRRKEKTNTELPRLLTILAKEMNEIDKKETGIKRCSTLFLQSSYFRSDWS